MEVVHGTYCSKAAKFGTQEDIINRMPDDVITNIIDRLPIQDAVRTSILSSVWRSKWTMLSKLTFDFQFYNYLTKKGRKKSYGYIISRILANLKGTITRFSIQMYEKCEFEQVNHWLLCLSRKGIEEISLANMSKTPLKLPTHLFSCLKLKRMRLRHYLLIPPVPTFHGFPNLLYLYLDKVTFAGYYSGLFLSQCPLLRGLKISQDSINIDRSKQVELAKLKNLIILDIPLCKFKNMAMITSSSIFGLMGLFPKLQRLNLHFLNCKILADSGEKVMNAIPCLKTLELEGMDFSCANSVSCAYELIRGCANLQKVVLKSIKGLENEICLIKSILTCSPLLKTMDVYTSAWCNATRIKVLASKLLELQRAYPKVEIVLH